MFVHLHKHSAGFALVPNGAARHEDLSLTARGLLVTLLTTPDGARATVESIAEQVREGKRAVSLAYRELEDAWYLRRERRQDPETGLWTTSVHVSDVPMDEITPVEPQEPTTAPTVAHLVPVDPEPENEPETVVQSVPEIGQAASALSALVDVDKRLKLSATETLRLAPLAAEWLTAGHTVAVLRSTLTTRLPMPLTSAFALISYRLKNQMPAPKPVAGPDVRPRCEGCGAIIRGGSYCSTCLAETTNRASAPSVEETADVAGHAAGIRAQMRARRTG